MQDYVQRNSVYEPKSKHIVFLKRNRDKVKQKRT